jgi:hypothetical protein
VGTVEKEEEEDFLGPLQPQRAGKVEEGEEVLVC